MCGLMFAKRGSKYPVKKALLKRYNNQSSRGKRGYGFIPIENGKIGEIQRFETETETEKAIKDCSASEILFHHRTPTSTINHKDATHPIVVKNEELEHDYYVIHNGVLRNEGSHKTKHEGLGYEYTTILEEITTIKSKNHKKETVTESFNDSEAFAIELARYLDGKSETIDAVGTIAFICLETDKKGNVQTLHYGRNSGNPLVIERQGDLFFIKSEGNKDDETVLIDTLHSIDYKSNVLTTKHVPIGRVSFQSNSGTYAPFTQRNAAGFGYPKDDERTSQLSPLQVRSGNLLDWGGEFGEDDLPFSSGLPTIDYDGRVRNYQDSEEYLIDLEAEIESLERDIRDCRFELDRPNLSAEDTDFHETYMAEVIGVLREKIKERDKLEDRLAGKGM